MARIKRHSSTSDSMDEWLDSQGYYRKHIAKDGSCLFRAVSEQVFNTQVFHSNVRTCCADYMDRNRELFVEFIDGPFDVHLANLQNSNDYAGQVEMSALSLLLKRDFLVFHEVGKDAYNVTDNGFEGKIMLHFSQGNHYDSVYHKNVIADAAMSQSLIYEILYKRVFRMGDEVDLAVEKMLHDKAYAKMRKDSTASMDSNWCADLQDAATPLMEIGLDDDNDEEEDKSKDPALEIRRALAQGYPPFPYKVAKALDPQIYRNVEFDVWNEAQKDLTIFEPGVKCLVRLDKDKPESYHAHIQEISADKGPVTVYIVELGKKQTIPYACLEPLPAYNKGWQTFGNKNVASYYNKPHVNGAITDLDKYKGKKKVYKKGKYKPDVTFAVPLACGGGPGLPTRMHHPQAQFEPTVVPLVRGRGRIPYQAIPRNPSPHMKWISPTHASNQRYRVKSGGTAGGRYYVPNVNPSPHEGQHRMYTPKTSYDAGQHIHHHREPAPLMSCAFPATSAQWSKDCSQSSFQHHGSSMNNQSSSDGNRSSNNMPTSNGEMEVAQSADIPVSGNPPPSPNLSVSASPLSTYTAASACTQGSIPSAAVGPVPSGHLPTTPCPSTPSSCSSPSAHMPMGQPLMASTPTHHQVTLYPCHYYAGMYVPYEAPQLPVNFAAMRSQDPSGADLPLQDLGTLRFFFNLGCDYFRMSTVVQVPPSASQYGVWNCNGPTTYGQAPYNGYLTPLSGSDCYEAADDSASVSCSTPAGLSPQDSSQEGATAADSSPLLTDELYDAGPAYLYSSSPVTVYSQVYHPPLDYPNTPGLLGEYKNALVLNDGVLSLGPGPPMQPAVHGSFCTPRHRSDSNGSQHSNGQEWSRAALLTSSVSHHAQHHEPHYYGDSNYVDGNQGDGNHGNGNHSNGNHSNGNHNNGNHGNGNHSNEINGNGSHGNGNYGNGNHSNGNYGNGGSAVYHGNGGAVVAVATTTSATNGGSATNGASGGYPCTTVAPGSYPGNHVGSTGYSGIGGAPGSYPSGNGGTGSYAGGGSSNGQPGSYPSGNGNGNGGCVNYPAGAYRHSSSKGGGAGVSPSTSLPPRFLQRRNVSPQKQQYGQQYGGSMVPRQSSMVPVGSVSTAAYPLLPTVTTPGLAGAYPVAVAASTPSNYYQQRHPAPAMYPVTTHSQHQTSYFPASG